MAEQATQAISDEKPATAPRARALAWAVVLISVAMSLYHMYVAAFGPPETLIFRGTHLLFALTLVFILYPLAPQRSAAWRLVDAALLAAGWAMVLHIFINYDYFINRIIYIDDLTAWDKIYSVAAVVVILEATRRVIGWALPLTAIVFLVYAIFFTNVRTPVLMEQLYFSTEGIFGATLGVSASYVMLFVLFGAFMERSGTGQLFMDFALSITGHTAGGPGKVAIVSSSLFGTVSGSAVANVMVDGPITIPLMKRTGFRPPFAAAVEAVASTGGQIMPPVMGAAAFVMAEFLVVPYAQVAMWALIPAILYYVGLFFAVHFEAKRCKLLGVPRHLLPRFSQVMLVRGHLFAPILVVLTGLILGYSAPLCALAGALACLPVALMRASTRAGIGWANVLDALVDGAKNTLAVANVMVDGPITIPLMKRTGFRPPFAAAVEAVASTGGQIMPPVMGAAAFVMAEFLVVPYAQVAMWALIPAILYYVGLFFAVHFEAKRCKLLGVPRHLLPRFSQVMLVRGHLFAPILVVLTGLILGYSAPLCALAGALACLPVALMRASTRAGIGWANVLDALVDGAKNTLAVAMACACAGIVIGVVTITGLGITFTQMVITLSQNSLVLALILTAMAGIILGMGMPTTPAYIVMVSLLVPAIIKLGAVTPAAHMFAFYFAILSAITPPVALAVFAAAGLAKANMWEAGYEAVRLAAPTYIVPFMFVYEPALLTIGDPVTVIWRMAASCVGVMCFAAGLQGYMLRETRLWERGALLVAAFLLIKPDVVTDIIGLALLGVVTFSQWSSRGAPPAAEARTESAVEGR